MARNLDTENKETDVLGLSVEQWVNLLNRKDIFNDDLLQVLIYVYEQPNHESTATEIGKALGSGYQAVTSLYVRASKKVYDLCGKEPMKKSNGQYRYWNTFFLQLEDQKSKRVKRNDKTLYRLILRPNLAAAMELNHVV